MWRKNASKKCSILCRSSWTSWRPSSQTPRWFKALTSPWSSPIHFHRVPSILSLKTTTKQAFSRLHVSFCQSTILANFIGMTSLLFSATFAIQTAKKRSRQFVWIKCWQWSRSKSNKHLLAIITTVQPALLTKLPVHLLIPTKQPVQTLPVATRSGTREKLTRSLTAAKLPHEGLFAPTLVKQAEDVAVNNVSSLDTRARKFVIYLTTMPPPQSASTGPNGTSRFLVRASVALSASKPHWHPRNQVWRHFWWWIL